MDTNSNNEDIIIPKKSKKVPVRTAETQNEVSKKRTPIILIAGIVIFVIVAVIITVVIVINNPGNNESGTETSEVDDGNKVEVKTIYATPDDSEDPDGDYKKWLEDQKEKAESDSERFDAEIRIINNEISKGNYDDALSRLDAISRDSLDDTQLFRLYNVYTRVFDGNGDTERYNEYVQLRTEKLNIINGE